MSPVVQRLSRPRLLIIAAFALLSAITVGPLAPHADAATTAYQQLSTFDQRLLADINHARTSRGIRALSVVAGTTDIAHGWSCHQASSLVLAHNLNLGTALARHGSADWTTYGENVGMESTTMG